jgi:hypothetical protein
MKTFNLMENFSSAICLMNDEDVFIVIVSIAHPSLFKSIVSLFAVFSPKKPCHSFVSQFFYCSTTYVNYSEFALRTVQKGRRLIFECCLCFLLLLSLFLFPWNGEEENQTLSVNASYDKTNFPAEG